MKRPKKTTLATSDKDSGMPSYNLSLPVLLIMFIFFMVFGGGIAYFATQNLAAETVEPTSFVLATNTIPPDTPTPTDTLVPTITNTPEPAPTLPPIEYVVQEGDTCSKIAGVFNISQIALITSNGLSVECYLTIGQRLQVPQPTPLPTTDAIATQSARQTQAACPIEYVTVQANDTIEIISQYTRVPVQEILNFNGKPSNLLFAGEILAIPTCKETVDLSGATFTPSPAPTYQAATIIQPPTGTYFQSNDEIILQWVSPAELRANEYFLVTILDSTDGGTLVLEETVKDTRFIVPTSAKPSGTNPHIFAWKVGIIAQIGEDADGNPIFRESGPDSTLAYFAWAGN